VEGNDGSVHGGLFLEGRNQPSYPGGAEARNGTRCTELDERVISLRNAS
jgi:hypothetical protein